MTPAKRAVTVADLEAARRAGAGKPAPDSWDLPDDKPVPVPPEIAVARSQWSRRMWVLCVVLIVAGAGMLLSGIFAIRDHPTKGYLMGAAGIAGLCFGVLAGKLAAYGPYPVRLEVPSG